MSESAGCLPEGSVAEVFAHAQAIGGARRAAVEGLCAQDAVFHRLALPRAIAARLELELGADVDAVLRRRAE